MPDNIIPPPAHLRQYNIVSFSGGKDSTAMLLMMLERGIDVNYVICATSNWDFPQLIKHINKVKENVKDKVGKFIIINVPFDYWLLQHKTKNRTGYGWANAGKRWCTGTKRDLMHKVMNCELSQIGRMASIPYTWFVGIAADEPKRIKEDPHIRYPLYEWGVTEKEALQYCYDNGYDFGGLYRHFDRVSCFCCPLQSMKDLWKLRHYYPELWEKLVEKDRLAVGSKFRPKETLDEIALKLDKLNFEE